MGVSLGLARMGYITQKLLRQTSMAKKFGVYYTVSQAMVVLVLRIQSLEQVMADTQSQDTCGKELHNVQK
jgi:uncharacterized membrane protein